MSRSVTTNTLPASSPTSIQIDPAREAREVFLCGGAQVYAQGLPLCSDLYLTLVKREVEGDVFFPPFEDHFVLLEQVVENADFQILHYVRRPPG